MPLPPVQIVNQTEYFVSGDVSIDEMAVIAPGVILQAAPNSQIRIGQGVCIGKGTILNAYGGIIAIEAGVTLGAGVLIIGRCSVGEGACVGTTTTIINSSVEALSLIPAGSLLGDTSRDLSTETQSIAEELPSPWEEETETEENNKSYAQNKVINRTENRDPVETKSSETVEVVSPGIPSEKSIFTETKQPVVGQVYINQLLITLFPERQKFAKS